MNNIYYTGDSINAHNSIVNYPQAGIAQALELYIKKDIKIYNRAMNGRSTKSYIDQGFLEAVSQELGEGDFLFVQFGHNDEKDYDPARYTEPFGSFKDNLRKFIRIARDAGATPVLVTPLERRCFADAWKLDIGAHGEYVQGMKEVAEEERVALIDLYTKSRELMEEAGAVKTTAWFMHLEKGKYLSYPEGKLDNTHLNHEGARIFAGLVAEGLYELGGIYKELLVEGIEAVLDGRVKGVI